MLRHLNRSLTSSVLSYVVMLSIVILAICLSFLLVHEEFEYQYKSLLIKNRISDNVGSAIALVNSGYHFEDNKDIKLRLYNSQDDSLTFSKSRWGVYDLVKINFTVSSINTEKIGLWGSSYSYSEDPSLLVSSTSSSISLGSSVSLSGRLVIPGGFFTGSLGSSLCKDAKVERSLSSVIEILNKNSIYTPKNGGDSVMFISDNLKLEPSYKNSFYNKTVYLKVKGDVCLDNITIVGNIVVESDNTITVKQSCSLDNSILKARKIFIADNFKGRLQVFAKDSIIVGNGVVLKYPSALICCDNNSSSISIGNNTTICGGVVLINDDKEGKNHGLVKLSNKATVHGLIYTSTNIDCKGMINGSIYCNRVLSEKKSMFYENCMDSIFLNRMPLPKYFAMPAILNGHKKKLICWLK